MSAQVILEDQLISALNLYYNIHAHTVEALNLGADMHASLFKVNSPTTVYFVKIKHDGQTETAVSVIKLLQDAHIKELIFPVAASDGNLFKAVNHHTMTVYPFIDGRDGFSQPLTETQWKLFGAALKKVHSISIPAPLQQALRQETYSPKWRDIVKSLQARLEAYPAGNKIVDEFRRYYQAKHEIINQLVISRDELCKQIQPDQQHKVLCHSDIHAGNLFMTANDEFYLVDWDEPMMAPKERDLMFIGGGVGNVWNLPEESVCFYEGYGKTEIDHTILSYYRHERIIEDIAVYGLDILSDKQQDQAKLISLKHFKSQFERHGVVDIAFNSDT